MFDSNNFTKSSMFSFQNAWPIKRKSVYTLVLFHIYIYMYFPCENPVRSQLPFYKIYFFNFSDPSSGKKCCLRW